MTFTSFVFHAQVNDTWNSWDFFRIETLEDKLVVTLLGFGIGPFETLDWQRDRDPGALKDVEFEIKNYCC